MFMSKVNQTVNNMAASVAQKGQMVANNGKKALKAFGSPSSQIDLEGKIRSGVNNAYSKVSQGFNHAVTVLERQDTPEKEGSFAAGGIQALNTPIEVLRQDPKLFEVSETDSKTKKTLKNAANHLKTYHSNVNKVSEKVSRTAGTVVHGIVRAMFIPVRGLFKLLRFEAVGALIQNSVALAVGFAVRGIVLALMQIVGHIGPYAAVAGAIGGVAFGLSLLHFVAAPVVAASVSIAVIFGLVLLMQQVQILMLNKKVDNQSDTINELIGVINKRHAESQDTYVARVKQVCKNHPKTVCAAILASVAAGTYFFGTPALVKDAAQAISAKGAEVAQAVADRLPETPAIVQQAVDKASAVVDAIKARMGQVSANTGATTLFEKAVEFATEIGKRMPF